MASIGKAAVGNAAAGEAGCGHFGHEATSGGFLTSRSPPAAPQICYVSAALEPLDVDRIGLGVFSTNAPAIACFECQGISLVGVWPAAFGIGGAEADVRWMTLACARWAGERRSGARRAIAPSVEPEARRFTDVAGPDRGPCVCTGMDAADPALARAAFLALALTFAAIAAWSFTGGHAREHAVCVGAALFVAQLGAFVALAGSAFPRSSAGRSRSRSAPPRPESSCAR